MTAKHGYVSYTHGCRCEVCRKAKADYMRTRRAIAREAAQASADARVPGILHGARASYEERGCRCTFCVAAKRVQWRREGWARTDRRRAS